jgi:hypothetical protein
MVIIDGFSAFTIFKVKCSQQPVKVAFTSITGRFDASASSPNPANQCLSVTHLKPYSVLLVL